MKKTLLITAIALVTATGMSLDAMAQRGSGNPANCPAANCPANGGGGKMGRNAGNGRMMMMSGLNLTDAQKTQIRDIMTQQREETHAKIRAVLTPEQQAIFDARKQQRDAWFDQRMNGF
ncbi:MAG: Spy/CpxP family protein refolding chaperone [Burkholderiales bacterium]|jgi:Spy/CpxP family protein refolding chaperone|nr:Spy/CpxP family protein refolding chaperone [Burkholderiales bacterium]